MVGLSSWQAQLVGRKTWSLYPPPECEHKCQAFNVTMETGDVSKCSIITTAKIKLFGGNILFPLRLIGVSFAPCSKQRVSFPLE